MNKKAFALCLWMIACQERGGHGPGTPEDPIKQGNTGLVSSDRAHELQSCLGKSLGTAKRSVEGYDLFQLFRECDGKGVEEFRASLDGVVEPSADGHTFQVK